MRHDPCELSIAYGNLYGALNTRRYTLVQGFCLFWLFLMEGKGLKVYMNVLHFHFYNSTSYFSVFISTCQPEQPA